MTSPAANTPFFEVIPVAVSTWTTPRRSVLISGVASVIRGLTPKPSASTTVSTATGTVWPPELHLLYLDLLDEVILIPNKTRRRCQPAEVDPLRDRVIDLLGSCRRLFTRPAVE